MTGYERSAVEVLASFLPRERLNRLVGPESPERPVQDRIEGAILFVDVSGFTGLTERLSRLGAIGSERLSGLIDAYFGHMTDQVLELGGDVIAYAGDAMLAMWPATPQRGLEEATWLAAQTALRAQNDRPATGEHASEPIRIRASVACGPMVLLEVGGVDDRWQFLVGGRPLDDAAEGDSLAQPGDVILAPAASSILGDRCAGSPLPGGFQLLDSLEEAPTSPPITSPLVTANRIELIRACVPDFIVSRLEADQFDWLAEFRTVSVQFVNLRHTVGELRPLHRSFEAMQRLVNRFEGTVYQTLVDDKGISMVVAFGLPLKAHENDAVRAIRCATELQDRLAALDVASSIGVATGLVFAGIYGSDTRRQYTLVGSAMNRGARLAQAAGGGVLCDDATRLAALRQGRLSFETLPPLDLKGIEKSVPVFRPLTGSSSDTDSAVNARRGESVVGRTGERAILDEAVRALVSGEGGGFVMIEGEAGIGKSRLVGHALERAAQSARCLVGEGLQIERTAFLHAWRPVFEELLAIDPSERGAAAILERLKGRFRHDPGVHDLLPLLSPVLPVDFPDSERTRDMPPEARADATIGLLVDLLSSAAEADPTLLVMEDTHWLDSTSLALLGAVVDRIPGLLVIASARPVSADEPPMRLGLYEAAGHRLEIGAVDKPDSEALIRACLGVGHVPTAITDVVYRRAQGNPFFSEQLAYALRDFGLISVDGETCSAEYESAADLERALDGQLSQRGLPGTLLGVVNSRIDRLSPDHQLTVKMASVIGPSFELEALRCIYPDQVRMEDLSDWLTDLVRLEIAAADPAAGETGFSFRHAILRDVAYNSLTFGQRKSTHTAVAEWIERDEGGTLARNFPVLAHHWAHAGVRSKAAGYLGAAGDEALKRYANEEAVRFFEDAIAMDSPAEISDPTPSTGTRSVWELQLGLAYVNWSRYDEGQTHLRRGLELSGHAAPGSPVSDGLGLAAQVGRQVAHRLWPARFVGRRRDSSAELQRIARAYESLVEAFYLENAPLPCLLSAVRSLNLAELGGSSAELARGYASFGAILGFVPAHGLADAYFRRALSTAGHVDDVAARAWVGLAVGVYKVGVGAWEQAEEHLSGTREVAERLGDRRRWDDAVQNLAAREFLLGRYERSRSLADDMHESASDRKDERALSVALRRRALCQLATNELDDLAPCLRELSSYAMGTDDLYRDLPPLALTAQLHLRRRRYGEAFEAAERALAVMTSATPTFHDSLSDFVNVTQVLCSLGRIAANGRAEAFPDVGTMCRNALKALRRYARVFPIGQPHALLWSGVLLHSSGKTDRAVLEWRKSVEVAKRMGMTHAEGLARLELGSHLARSDERHQQLSRAAEIFERLGAVHESEQTSLAQHHV